MVKLLPEVNLSPLSNERDKLSKTNHSIPSPSIKVTSCLESLPECTPTVDDAYTFNFLYDLIIPNAFTPTT